MLASCRHREGTETPDVFRCASPKIIGLKRVKLATCSECHYRDHALVSGRVELPRIQECLRLGPAISVGLSPGEPLFECRHPRHRTTTEKNCRGCEDYLFPLITPESSPAEVGKILAEPARLQQDGWWRWPNAREGFRQAADRFLNDLPPFPNEMAGRGMVITGGGKYFASAYVTIRIIRHVGCELPIELWHFKDEISPPMREALQPFGVRFIEADGTGQQPFRFLRDHWWKGWQLKACALLRSSFREVIFLDADCYPTRDPSDVFEWDEYRRHGSIFWPDLETSDFLLPEEAWAIFGAETGWRPLETGQLVVNKEACWRELSLAAWYNERADFTYRIIYGDKDTFNIAWKKLNKQYATTGDRPTWETHTYIHAGPDGKPLFQHRVRDKFKLCDEEFLNTTQHAVQNEFNPKLAHESECFGFLDELRSLLPPRGSTILDQPGSRSSGPSDAVIAREKIIDILPVRTAEEDRILFSSRKILTTGHFNPGLCRLGDNWLVASRVGEQNPALFLTLMDREWNAITQKPFRLDHHRCRHGQEDPRLFWFGGRLHLAFTGLEYRDGLVTTNQMLAELDPDLEPVGVWQPEYADRNQWQEKNWVFFAADEELHSVYSIAPHVILTHSGITARKTAETNCPINWDWGHLRGGAPPVRVRDECYHWFHGTRNLTIDGAHTAYYTLGLYTFDARWPHEIKRWVPQPLLHPDIIPGGKPVVFPCGAARDDEQWIITHGWNDLECRVVMFDFTEIEKRLVSAT